MTPNERAQFEAAVDRKEGRLLRVRELRLEYRARPDLDIVDAYRNLTTPQEAAGFLMQLLAHEATEVFGIVCLSIKHDFICWHEVARGSLDQCHVHPREVFKAALLANAACIVLGHYVARNIMPVMCRRSLCGRGQWKPPITPVETLIAGT